MARLVEPPYHPDGGEINAPDQDPAVPIDWEALSPVPVRLASSVAAQIEEMVVSGRLEEGRRLPSERRLAELLSVSRGSVREAITELEVKGLVTRRPGSGTHVQAPSHSFFTGPIVAGAVLSDRETTELWDLREAIEPAVAARAAERRTDADVDRLQELAATYAATGGDVEQRIVLDASFHQAVAAATRNDLLAGLVERFMHGLDATRRASMQNESRWRMSSTAHERIVAAIAAGDPDAAEREMLQHVRKAAAFAQSHHRGGRRPSRQHVKGEAS